jgi:hypothetical protein
MTLYILFEMDYKPYTLEWSRKRYLNEAIQKYFDSDVDADIIIEDIVDCLSESITYHKSMKDKMQFVADAIRGLNNEGV